MQREVHAFSSFRVITRLHPLNEFVHSQYLRHAVRPSHLLPGSLLLRLLDRSRWCRSTSHPLLPPKSHPGLPRSPSRLPITTSQSVRHLFLFRRLHVLHLRLRRFLLHLARTRCPAAQGVPRMRSGREGEKRRKMKAGNLHIYRLRSCAHSHKLKYAQRCTVHLRSRLRTSGDPAR